MFDFTTPICDIKGKPIVINEATGETKPLADLIARHCWPTIPTRRPLARTSCAVMV